MTKADIRKLLQSSIRALTSESRGPYLDGVEEATQILWEKHKLALKRQLERIHDIVLNSATIQEASEAVQEQVVFIDN